ncbi:MAG: non-canonical purine NTP diphosphatase [Bacteroidales bacterium]
MVKELVFATNNMNKLREVQQLLPGFRVLGLSEIGCNEDIPETADTLEGNSMIKARWVKERYGYDCFADDTGLEVAALDGAPGVISARYAGEGKSSEDNMSKLLSELDGKSDRTARFRTVVTLVMGEEYYTFEGIVKGEITMSRSGAEGFGYDPIFKAEGFDKTFAEIPLSEKNKVSHRARAVRALIEFLNQ